VTTTLEKFLAFEADLNNVLLERTTEVHLATLAILAKRHMFMLGEPGVGKSMLVDQITKRIQESRKFKWLLTKGTVPEEIFGGPDLLTFKNEGIYRRVTTGKLPAVEFAMLDEIFNASDAILNSLLLLINEGEFINPGEDSKVPLLTLFAASNSMPQTAELEALVDRLIIRVVTKAISDDSNFVQMMLAEDYEPQVYLTLDEITEAQAEVAQVEVTDSVMEAILKMRNRFKEEDIWVSDRRFHQVISIIKAEAWLNGRTSALVEDTKPLVYSMWREPSQIEKIREIIYDLADPIEAEVLALSTEMEAVFAEFKSVMADTTNPNRRGKQAMESLNYYKKAKREYLALYERAKDKGQVPTALTDFKKRLQVMGPVILREGLEIDDEDIEEFDAKIEKRSQDFE
jgi:MoxR-like ATPase